MRTRDTITYVLLLTFLTPALPLRANGSEIDYAEIALVGAREVALVSATCEGNQGEEVEIEEAQNIVLCPERPIKNDASPKLAHREDVK